MSMKRLLLSALLAIAAVSAIVSGATAADIPELRLCTGSSKGNYYFAGSEIARHFFSSAVPTLAVEALVVLRSDWADQNRRGLDEMSDAVLRASPSIRQKVGG